MTCFLSTLFGISLISSMHCETLSLSSGVMQLCIPSSQYRRNTVSSGSLMMTFFSAYKVTSLKLGPFSIDQLGVVVGLRLGFDFFGGANCDDRL